MATNVVIPPTSVTSHKTSMSPALPVQPLPTDATHPSIELTYITHHYTGPILQHDDNGKGSNYSKWSKAMIECLALNNLSGYIYGTIERPGDDQPRAQRNWDKNDGAAAAVLCLSIATTEQKFVNSENMGAKECWDVLEERHRDDQLFLLYHTLAARAGKGEDLLSHLEDVEDKITRVFRAGALTKDTMILVCFLLALRNNHEDLQMIIVHHIVNATDERPYTVDNLRRLLDIHQTLRDMNKSDYVINHNAARSR